MPQAVIILLIIVGAFGVISGLAFIIYRLLNPKLKNDDQKPSEEQITQENLDRYLKPIEDEEVAKQISDYKDEEE